MTVFISSAEAVASPPGTFSHKYKHCVQPGRPAEAQWLWGGDSLAGLMVFFDGNIHRIRFHMQMDSGVSHSVFRSAQSGRGTALKRFEEVFTAEHIQYEEQIHKTEGLRDAETPAWQFEILLGRILQLRTFVTAAFYARWNLIAVKKGSKSFCLFVSGQHRGMCLGPKLNSGFKEKKQERNI